MWWISVAFALEIDPNARWLDHGFTRCEAVSIEWRDTLIFPVLEGGERVGFVSIGDGNASFRLESPGEALGLAARFVDKEPIEPLRSSIASQEWTDHTDRALFLGLQADAFLDIDTLPRVTPGVKGVSIRTNDGWEVIVSDANTAQAARDARQVLSQRSEALTTLGMGPQGILQSDAHRAVAEWRTDRNYPASSSTTTRWLTWVRDDSGAADLRRDQIILAYQATDWNILTGHTRASEATGATVTQATVNLAIGMHGNQNQVDATARLRVQSPVATRTLTLRIPNQRDEPAPGIINPSSGGFRVESIIAAGVSELPMTEGWGLFLRGDDAIVQITLPAEIPAGGATTVDVLWHDTWAASHLLDGQEYAFHELMDRGGCHGPQQCAEWASHLTIGTVELGAVSTAHLVVPSNPWQSRAFPAELRVGTMNNDRWTAVLGGVLPEKRVVGDARWWIGKGTALTPVSFGAFDERVDDPVAGFPGLRTAEFGLSYPPDASFIRSVIHFFSGSLPAYPLAEVTIVEGARQPSLNLGDERGAEVLTAANRGNLVIEGILSLGGIDHFGTSYESPVAVPLPHPVEMGLVEAVISGWWADLGWSYEDAWLERSIEAYYRDRFAEVAYFDSQRKPWSDALDAAVTENTQGTVPLPFPGSKQPWIGDWGGRLFDRALRERIGEEALLKALDAFRGEGGPPTLARLRATLAKNTEIPLDDFFETWVIAGLRPTISGQWTAQGRTVTVEIEAEPAIGRYEVPVVVRTGRGFPTITWVLVEDGNGRAEIPVNGAPKTVSIDPAESLPLFDRRMQEVTLL